MGIIKKYKSAFIILIVAVLAFTAYSVFFAGGVRQDESLLTTNNAAVPEAAITSELISLLLEMKVLKLDNSLFSDKRFRSLTDFSVTLTPQPIGRSNPFLPLGVSSSEEAGATGAPKEDVGLKSPSP